jgi:two-component system sensor histidine kinase BaeS
VLRAAAGTTPAPGETGAIEAAARRLAGPAADLALPLGGALRRTTVLPLHPDSGQVLLSRDPTPLRALQTSAWITLLAVGAAIGVLGVAASLQAARRIARPLQDLTAVADAMSAGRLDARVEVRGRDEVARLGHAFNNMAGRIAVLLGDLREESARAEAANRAKDGFLASMSHELRTPATNIRAYAEILESWGEDTAPQERREFLHVILDQTSHLESLIAQVLDFAQLVSGGVAHSIREGDLAVTVAEVCAGTAAAARERGVTIRLDLAPAPGFAGDLDRIAQLVRLLLDNALRYSPPGGTVDLRLRAGTGAHELSVDDRGPGIPDVAKQAVFEPFHQHGNRDTGKPAGMGLGLTFVRAIARAHDGDAWCEDRPGGGARLRVRLRSQAARLQPALAAPGAAT